MNLVDASNNSCFAQSNEQVPFLGKLPEGLPQKVLSFLPEKDVDHLGTVNGSMLCFLHADRLAEEAFLDQLEHRQKCGIPLTYKEHQRCAKLVQDAHIQRLVQQGRNGCRGKLPIETRLASIVQHLDCTDRQVNDFELRQIVTRYPNLQSLNLGCRSNAQISDEGCAFISQLSQLQSLNLANQTNITNQGFARLNHLPLKSLSLKACRITDSTLQSLSNLAHTLKVLNLTFCVDVTDEGLSAIMGPSLSSLDLERCTVSDNMAQLLARSSLKELNLYCSSIGDRGLRHLQNLASLTHLNLSQCRGLSQNGLNAFFAEAICPLRYLVLNDCDSINCQLLERFKALTHLKLSDMELSDDSVAMLRTLSSLTHLDLSKNRDITPLALAAIEHLPLKSLNLGSCSSLLNDDGMQAVSAFSQLEELDLRSAHEITGDGFAALYRQPLKKLYLRHCNFVDEDLRVMAETFALRFLDLRIFDGFIDRLPTDQTAQALSLLPLEHLILARETFSESSQQFLKKLFPYIEVSNRIDLKRRMLTPFDRPFEVCSAGH